MPMLRAQRRLAGDVDAVDQQLGRGWCWLKPAISRSSVRLAGTRRAEQREELARLDVEVDVAQHLGWCRSSRVAACTMHLQTATAFIVACSRVLLRPLHEQVRQVGADRDVSDEPARPAPRPGRGRTRSACRGRCRSSSAPAIRPTTSRIVADSSTAAVMKLVTKPARMPPAISGTTTRRMVRSLVAPSTLGGFLERHVHLLQRRHARAQRIGQAAHGVGQHDQDPGAGDQHVGARQLDALEEAQVADRQHDARHRERGGGDPVEPLPRRQRACAGSGRRSSRRAPRRSPRPGRSTAACCGSCRSSPGTRWRSAPACRRRAAARSSTPARTTAAARRGAATARPAARARSRRRPATEPSGVSRRRCDAGAALLQRRVVLALQHPRRQRHRERSRTRS